MAVRPLRLFGDPVLRTPCRQVTRFDRQVAQLVDDLMDTVTLPGRAGLAAPQIGVDVAAFSFEIDGHRGYVLNPVMVSADDEYDGLEACLSIPGVSAETRRGRHAVVEGVDKHGDPMRVEGSDEFARCLQHETDHLSGLLYIDRLTGDQRRDALRQIRELQADGTL